jgi:S-adenosylmethionine-diacylglycerol 3-amino-3-carboxypropyl transferase
VLYARIHDHLRENLLRENSLLQLVFFGRYVWEPSLPIYLHADTFGEVKAALERVRIEIVTATVEDALAAAGEDRFDAFSLSDISSYLDDASHHRLFERLLGTARKDARLCSRSNIRHRPLAAEHSSRIRRGPAELEQELARRDHACVHEFVVGAVS